jgi:hypothetical protein
MNGKNFSARASFAGYFALAGIWFALGVFYAGLAIARSGSSAWQGSLIGFGVALLWTVWLGGFRLSVEGDRLIYRDGMYRTYTGSPSQITLMRNTWIEWKYVPLIRMPRLLIEFSGGARIIINTKPFTGKALAAFRQKLEPKLSRQGESAAL